MPRKTRKKSGLPWLRWALLGAAGVVVIEALGLLGWKVFVWHTLGTVRTRDPGLVKITRDIDALPGFWQPNVMAMGRTLFVDVEVKISPSGDPKGFESCYKQVLGVVQRDAPGWKDYSTLMMTFCVHDYSTGATRVKCASVTIDPRNPDKARIYATP